MILRAATATAGRHLAWATLALLGAIPCFAAIHQVPQAIPTIQEALDTAAVGDTIYVAPGTYTGPMNKNLDFWGKDLALIGYGGSAATIIDCELDGRGINLTSGESEASLVQGFTIRNGFGTDRGGAILCYCNAKFRDLILIDNTALHGGGISCSYGGSPDLDNLLIQGNLSTGGSAGGGSFCNGSNAVIRNVVFRANEGGIGGGVKICGTECFIEFENVVFEENISRDIGGGLSCSGSTVTMLNCDFINNFADNIGGGMRIGASTFTVENCRFVGNSSGDLGGAICAEWDFGSLFSNTLILNNESALGGGIYAGEYTDSADTRLRNVTFSGNRSTSNTGAAICALWQAEVDIAECLITGNLSGGAYFTDAGAAIHTACNNVYGNEGGNYTGDMTDQTGINGNISEDPFLCDLPGGDYHVAELSPCLPENNGCGVLMGRYGQGCVLTATPPDLPPGLRLEQNHPNPFNPRTEIRFTLPVAGPVNLAVFDLAGRKVKDLIRSESFPSGDHAGTWNGRDSAGKPVSSGVYLYRLEAAGGGVTRKMTLLR